MVIGNNEHHFFAFTVQGIDRRDNSSFEDFCICCDCGGGEKGSRESIQRRYTLQGYDITNVVFEEERQTPNDIRKAFYDAEVVRKNE